MHQLIRMSGMSWIGKIKLEIHLIWHRFLYDLWHESTRPIPGASHYSQSLGQGVMSSEKGLEKDWDTSIRCSCGRVFWGIPVGSFHSVRVR